MIRCNVIATGSSGNAVLLSDFILIDCGVPYKLIRPYIKDIKLVLLTHRHGDHLCVSTVKRIAAERPLIRFVCGEFLVEILTEKCNIPRNRIDVISGKCGIDYKECIIDAVWLYHDVPNIGYKIEVNGEKIFYATDTGSLAGIKAINYDLYLIEANHTEDDINKRIAEKHKAGQIAYEERAKTFHLSAEQAEKWLSENASFGFSRVILLHRHVNKEEKHND